MSPVRGLFGAPAPRRFLLRGGLLVAVAALTIGPAGLSWGSHAPRSTEFPNGEVQIHGHGWGPGVGMGQWGAFGYAAQYHKSYSWILSHFYGGTTLSTMSVAAEGTVRVDIIENAGYPVIVTSPSPFTFDGIKFAAKTAGRATLNPTTGLFTISEAPSCTAKASSWKSLRHGISADPEAIPASLSSAAPLSDLLTLCRKDGTREVVRGRIIAYKAANKPLLRTLNQLPLESYIADVVPAESSTGWGEVGGKGLQGEQWGFQELEAQAVAARTYLLAYMRAGGWQGYASICDNDYCQSYPGVADESALAWHAVRETTGQYLTEKGVPVAAQYSASTGGYTTKSAFPAVADAGDSVCLQNTGYWTCNPEHNWTVTIPVYTVQQAFPSIGTLEAITVTSRNGLGDWGGRAVTVKVTGSKKAVTVSGDTFQSDLGLDSDWFIILHPAPATTTTSTSTTSSTSSSTTTTVAPHRTLGGGWPVLRHRADLHGLGGGTGPLPGGSLTSHG